MVERTEAMTAASAPLHAHEGSYVDWPAIIAGGVTASAIALLFGAFGASLGLSAVSPQIGEGSGGFALIIIGAWTLVTLLVSYGTGGYIAGRMRRRMGGADADEVTARDSIHGLVVWALGVLVGGWVLAGTVTGVVGAVGNTVGAVGSAVGQTAAAAGTAASNVSMPSMSSINPMDIINNRLLRGTGIQVNEDINLSSQSATILANAAAQGELSDADATYLAEQIAANSNLTQAEAEARVQEAAQQVTTAVDEAKQTARDAADAARRAAVLTGFALAAGLLIGAAAAVWAATIGGRHRDEGRIFSGFRI